MRYKNLALLLLLSLGLCFSAMAGGLKRKGSIGVQLAPVNDSIATANKMDKPMGFFIAGVFPKSTAANAGIESGDILVGVNGVELVDYNAFSDPKAKFKEGDKVTFTVLRKGKKKELSGNAIGKPYETSEKWEVIYDDVDFQGGKLRSIVTKPKGEGKHPAILIIPGFTCSSLDNLPEWHPYRRVVDGFSERGYVVYRVEKPGLGDCEGTPDCVDIDVLTETDAFTAGYKQLLTYDFVNQDEVFIFGHSMGGVIAPLIAAREHPKGVIVYGTSAEPWMEYLFRMLRFQNPRMGVDYLDNEKDMKLYHSLLYKHFIEKKSPQELNEENPEYGRLLKRDFWWDGGDLMFTRHYKFQQSIQDLNMAEAWAGVNSYVLSMAGESDLEIVDPDSHKEIVRIVNTYNPDKATFALLEETDHSFLKLGDMDKAFEVRFGGEYKKAMMENFNFGMLDEMDEWMQKVKKKEL